MRTVYFYYFSCYSIGDIRSYFAAETPDVTAGHSIGCVFLIYRQKHDALNVGRVFSMMKEL